MTIYWFHEDTGHVITNYKRSEASYLSFMMCDPENQDTLFSSTYMTAIVDFIFNSIFDYFARKKQKDDIYYDGHKQQQQILKG